MHYSLHMNLSVYRSKNTINSKTLANLLVEMNRIVSGKIKVRFDQENDGWDELEIWIQ